MAAASPEADALKAKIVAAGDEVRNLKTAKAEKAKVDEALKVLLTLKSEYKTLTGEDYQAPGAVKKEEKKPKEQKPKPAPAEDGEKSKKQLRKEAKKAEKSEKKEAAKVVTAQPTDKKVDAAKKETTTGGAKPVKAGGKTAATSQAESGIRHIASQLPVPEKDFEVRFTGDNLPLAAFATATLVAPTIVAKTFKVIPGIKVVPELVTAEGVVVRGQFAIARYFALEGKDCGLYGYDSLSTASVDQWLDFALEHLNGTLSAGALAFLDQYLISRTYIVGYSTTLADIAVWASLTTAAFKPSNSYSNLSRWFKLLNSLPPLSTTEARLHELAESFKSRQPPAAGKTSSAPESKGPRNDQSWTSQKGKQTGSCPALPGAVEGKVCTRFPPEPSGYLHVGHIKAAMLNDYYARLYKGKLRLRFDDTNPSKEKMEFEQSIIEDLKRMEIVADEITYTSDYFAQLKDLAIKLIKAHKAYMDDTPVEQMRQERMDGVESHRRNTSVDENLRIFEELNKGNPEYRQYCLRAKIDMSAKNKTLRDPVLYRANETPHHRHGTKYKAYPTYDFACPIVDSLEGVTHALRTTEYNDRDAQYHWVNEALGLRPVTIFSFARMNFVHTVLSKRKLTWFVDNKHVDGWDDPRFPTIQGVLRRGIQVAALREFILGQGFSKRIVDMEWDKFWAINKKYVDPVAPRYTAIVANTAVELRLTNVEPVVKGVSIPLHPKNPEIGNKVVRIFNSVWIEGDDAAEIAEGEEVTLMRWGNAIVKKIVKRADGSVEYLEGISNPQGDVKATKKKITWLANVPDIAKVTLIEFDHLVTKPKLEDGDSVENFVNAHSRAESIAYADQGIRTTKTGEVVQFERRGYFRVDRPHLSDDKPAILFMVPDGKTKAMSSLSTKLAHR